MRAFPIALLLTSLAALGAALDWSAAGRVWWAHVQYLASDELQGRNVGSPGFDKAADYVADHFKQAGLTPPATASYFQPVEFAETSLDASRSSISLSCGADARPIPVPSEVQLGYSANSSDSIEARVVFAGYGLIIPEAHHNDLEGLPAQGAIVAYLSGGPGAIAGNLRSHYSSSEQRWRAFRAAGAVGMISIPNPKSMEIPWPRQASAWGRPRMNLVDSTSTAGLEFSASWNPERADDLLAGSGHSFREILEAAAQERPLPRFALPCSIAARLSLARRRVSSKNVMGVRAGTDPAVRGEYVVLSAHLDHLGSGKPVNGDAIYNGAMDDASGVASLIEIAAALARDKVQTRRSILFLAVTGEEKGELGSIFFANHPAIQGRIVADLNMDMFLPLFPLKWLEVQGLNESTLGDDIRKVAEAAGVEVQADKEPNRNRFIRSDQYSFIKKGVPALAFKFGYLPGAPEEKIFQNWYSERYHGVTDDVKQPVDLAAAARFNAILKNLLLRVADAPQAPSWKADSFFKRFVSAPD